MKKYLSILIVSSILLAGCVFGIPETVLQAYQLGDGTLQTTIDICVKDDETMYVVHDDSVASGKMLYFKQDGAFMKLVMWDSEQKEAAEERLKDYSCKQIRKK